MHSTEQNQRGVGGCLNQRHRRLGNSSGWELTALLKGRMADFRPCQLMDSNQQSFGYWPTLLTARLPAMMHICLLGKAQEPSAGLYSHVCVDVYVGVHVCVHVFLCMFLN